MKSVKIQIRTKCTPILHPKTKFDLLNKVSFNVEHPVDRITYDGLVNNIWTTLWDKVYFSKTGKM